MSDISLHVYETGSGDPPIVWIHGFGCAHADWDAQVSFFAQTNRCLALDLRGHGQSDRGTRDMTIEQLADDCADTLRSCNVQNAVAVGHSMGTRVALALAQRSPDLAAGLVLVDGSRPVRGATQAALDAFENAVAAKTWPGFARDLFGAMFFDDRHSELSSRLVERALSMPAERAHALYRNMITWDCNEADAVMAKTRIPVLLLQSTTRDAGTGRRSLNPGETGPYEALIATADSTRKNRSNARLWTFRELRSP